MERSGSSIWNAELSVALGMIRRCQTFLLLSQGCDQNKNNEQKALEENDLWRILRINEWNNIQRWKKLQ